MRDALLQWICCPICRTTLELCAVSRAGADEIDSGSLVCREGHTFPVRGGVPSLLPAYSGTAPSAPQDAPARAIAGSFDAEWSHFDYQKTRTWHATLEERVAVFLREVAAEPLDLRGRLVLDAGCGNGTLSAAIAELGAEVIAIDVGSAVRRAHANLAQARRPRLHFVQGNLLRLPVRDQSCDYVYSSGVLHHNPSTREALESVARALAPGGRIYVWVYHREPGLKFRLQLLLRSLVAPLPLPLKRAFVYLWSLQSMARQELRRLLARGSDDPRLTWRERIIDLMDIYTPRYRWMHTEEEVHRWYRELGLAEPRTTERRDWGFGVLGERPAT